MVDEIPETHIVSIAYADSSHQCVLKRARIVAGALLHCYVNHVLFLFEWGQICKGS